MLCHFAALLLNGLRDYGVAGQLGLEETPASYVANMVQVFEGVRRVLRDDGVLWLNLGDSYMCGETGRVDGGGPGRAFATAQRPCRERRFKAKSGLKPKNLLGVSWRLAFALQDAGWYLRSDCIWAKCLSGGTVVYAKTQKGEMPTTIKDLVRLDPSTVKLWDGQKWNQVVGWKATPRADEQLEIELRNGTRIGCTTTHRWPTNRGLLAASELKAGDVIDSCRLPEPAEPRDPSMLPAELVGWFVGLYIAEGSQSDGTIQIASHKGEAGRFERLKELAAAADGYCFVRCDPGTNEATANINSPVLLGVLSAYVAGRTAKDKHLHPRCWKRDNVFLRAVLDGYLSGDGHFDVNGRWRLGFTKNDALASDLRVICARIGASLRLRRVMHRMGKRYFPGWSGSLYFDPARRRQSDFEVVDIRPSRARMFWDISLAEEPHVFALGCGALTHNSNPMPESVTDRPTRSHEYVFLLTKSPRYFYDAEAVREKMASASASRYAYRFGGIKNETLAKADESGMGVRTRPIGYRKATAGRNLRTVWTIPTHSFKGAHFATFPPALARRCVLAGTSEEGCCPHCGCPWRRTVERSRAATRPGAETKVTGDPLTDGNRDPRRHVTVTKTTGWRPGCECENNKPVPCIVIDPFTGAGTSGFVAVKYGRRFVGCDLNPEYADMACRRIAELGRTLFDEVS